MNKLQKPVQIWDEDFTLAAKVGGSDVFYKPDKPATGYMYIENPVNLSQDIIQPGGIWRTKLAFDVDPQGTMWTIAIRPGEEIGEIICEARISLSQ